MVERLSLTVPWGCLRFVIVIFPDHTDLLFFIINNDLQAGQFFGADGHQMISFTQIMPYCTPHKLLNVYNVSQLG